MSKNFVLVSMLAMVAVCSGCKVAKDPVAVAEEPAASVETKIAPVAGSKAVEKAAAEKAVAEKAVAEKAAAEKAAAEKAAARIEAAERAVVLANAKAEASAKAAEKAIATAAEAASMKTYAISELVVARRQLLVVQFAMTLLLIAGGFWLWRTRVAFLAFAAACEKYISKVCRRWTSTTSVTPPIPLAANAVRDVEFFDNVVAETAVAETTVADVDDEFADVPAPPRTFKGTTGAEAAARCAERANQKRRRGDTRPMPVTSLGDLTAVGEA